ncbi:hypothetical protein Acsp06_26330 [Actinomycetospora sp. NBRC 106375]|uniref:DUF397 domain-containing protein n=1 Tax=Actinomycetospora sp. NBRC 106375 TaxID=3032207 RepID=UPI0024A341C6|nr:DUF397 domain-containing protein [Actinomycetospora sp. NBRC 106375]GLZ46448.1 hypothetical protein Acsp06_26330 [Actinomycetospora sp. NBRC 106375]
MTHGWRTSSFSSNGASCVEILEADGAAYLRDTKEHGDGAVLHLDGPAWSAFLDEVARDAPSANGAVEVSTAPAGGRAVLETSSGAVLHFRDDEWTAFRDGVVAGEFGAGT